MARCTVRRAVLRSDIPLLDGQTPVERLRAMRAAHAAPLLERTAGPAREPAAGAARLRALSPRPRGRLFGSALEGIDAAPLAVRVLSRMGFGPRPGDIEAFDALGATDSSRVAAYVEQQLDPAAIDDSQLDARLVAAGMTTLAKPREQLWAEHVANDPEWYVRLRPAIETERASFLRALYSRRQLVEVLADFWHDHFNVYGWDYISAPTWVHYDRDVVRANMLGNFRAMLEAVAGSPAMLVYLDNYTNSVAGPNENWARELFELHALGAENYLGVIGPSAVPRDGQGRPVGYTDNDVYEATRCFTGWTYDKDTGATVFRSDWHDRFQKYVLGSWISANQAPFEDGRDVLDILATHPGTARFIARKLCRRLIADEPPQGVVDAAAAVFAANTGAADQLARVVRTILLSPEFAAAWGQKVKRPFELVVSALRAAGAEIGFHMQSHTADSFLWLFDATGHGKFNWRSPDGYSDVAVDWLSTATMVPAWRLVNWAFDAEDDSRAKAPVVDVAAQTPPEVNTARALADYWIARILGRPLPDGSRTEVIEFMAQGRNPDVRLRLSDDDVRSRLVTMVSLIALGPHALWR
jgi:uncharacterized protein (DUF1800 family)